MGMKENFLKAVYDMFAIGKDPFAENRPGDQKDKEIYVKAEENREYVSINGKTVLIGSKDKVIIGGDSFFALTKRNGQVLLLRDYPIWASIFGETTNYGDSEVKEIADTYAKAIRDDDENVIFGTLLSYNDVFGGSNDLTWEA